MRGRDTVLRADKSDRAEAFGFRVSFDRMERGAGTVLRADRPDRSDRDAKDASDAAIARECAAKHMDPDKVVGAAVLAAAGGVAAGALKGSLHSVAQAFRGAAMAAGAVADAQIRETEKCIDKAK